MRKLMKPKGMLSSVLALAVVLSLLPFSGSIAQVPSVSQPQSGWVQVTRPTDLSATSSSSSTSLGSNPGLNALVYNVGSVAAYVGFGVTAPTIVATTGIPIPAGGCALLRVPSGNAFIGAITASGSTTLKVSTGTGAPANCATTGAVTVTGTTVIQAASQYPSGATPITGNAAGSTAAVAGSLAAASSKTTYICGFTAQAIGGTATVGPITVAGVVGSSMVFQTDINSATVGKTVAAQTFSPCVPASATNTAITVTTTANGTATAVDVNSWGYQL